MAVIFDRFDAWDDFLTHAAKPGVWRPCESDFRDDFRAKWTGTASLADAIHLARFGWPAGRARMADALVNVRAARADALTHKRDVAGAYPDVPRAVAGDPMSMISATRTRAGTQPVIRVDVDFCMSNTVPAEVIMRRGAILLNLVDQLENNGYSVELRITATMGRKDIDGNRAGYQLAVTFKRAGEPLDVDRAAFALAHASTLRRLMFSAIEQHADLERMLTHSYGRTMHVPAPDHDEATIFVPAPEHDGAHNDAALRKAIEQHFTDYLDND